MLTTVPTAAVVDSNGKVRQLNGAAEPSEEIRPDEIADGKVLARVLMRMLRSLSLLVRRWAPRRIDFEDVVVDASGTKTFTFVHGFGGRVRWWAVDVFGGVPALQRDATTNRQALVLTSSAACTVTIRVEESG